MPATEDVIAEVGDMMGHHYNPRPEKSIDFRIVYDADAIVNIEDHLRSHTISTQNGGKRVTM